VSRHYRWIKRLLGLYRNKRRHTKPSLLANYINYFTNTRQIVIAQHRKEVK